MESPLALGIALLLAPVLPGVILKVKALFAGKTGPPLLIRWYTLIKLLRKGSVYSTTTSFIFQVAPTVYFACLLTAILFVPFGNQPGLLSFNGDFVFFAYTLALGRFFMIIAALDTGMRRGEMLALRFADVDLDRLLITLRGSTTKSS